MSIPIIFCIHDAKGHYWPYLAVALRSVLLNSSGRHKVCILHNETLLQEAKDVMQLIASKCNANLKFIKVTLPTFLEKANFGGFSPASIYRLGIPELFKNEEMVVYLDSDLIFNGVEIMDLINSAPDASICAVLDPYIKKSEKGRNQLAALNLDMENYFNSGVLVMQPKKIERNLIASFTLFLKKNPVLSHPDQDFLNFEFKDVWGKLDGKYNHQVCVMERSLFKPIESYQGKVIHYVGKLKPLQGGTAPGFMPFWMYATGIEKAAQVFDAAPLSILEPDPNNVDIVIVRKIKARCSSAISPAPANFHDALVFHRAGQIELAQALYQQILIEDPKNAEALHLLGLVAYQSGNYRTAAEKIGHAIYLSPLVAGYHSNLGLSLQALNQLNAAVASYEKAISLEPDFADAYYNRGNALKELKQFNVALASYDKAISLKPNFAEAYLNRGIALEELGQLDVAVANYEKAIGINPDYADAYYNRGNALRELNQFDAAVASFNDAIDLKPDFPDAYYNRGNVLQDLREWGAAVESFDKAISLKPDFAQAFCNRGIALQDLNQLDSAVTSFDKAIILNSDLADAYWNKSLSLLRSGIFMKGWELYEWRWSIKKTLEFKRNFPQPLWLGEEPLSGKTILLHAEQGLGDTIQFCRYAKLVSEMGAKVVLEVQKPLVQLLKDLSGVSSLIAKGDSLPEFDFHCPLLSLPLAFKTDLKSMPHADSYLAAEPQRVTHWRERLKGDKFKIGIGWQGSRGTKIDVGRSFDLMQFDKIARLHNVQLISLQKGYGAEQLKNLPQGMEVMDLGDELDADGAFLDTAAVMMNLDLVITSDTALTHLGGALGVKTWVALKYVPDWRWMLDRADSPWYPSVTLYRQQRVDDWTSVFDQMQLDITL
jgi:hypothetical protein